MTSSRSDKGPSKRTSGSLPPKKRTRGRSRELTISYWRLLDLPTGQPVTDVDWQHELEKFARRRTDLDSAITGEVTAVSGENRLVLSRDRGTAPRQRDRMTGQKSPMPVTGADWDPIEEAFVTFLPSHNAFCYARSSISAPPPSDVATWLMTARLPSAQARWKVDPLVDPDRFERLQPAESALWVDIVARPPQQIVGQRRGLFAGLFSMRDVGEDIKIEIKVSTTGSTENRGTRRRLWEEAQRVRADIEGDGGVVERAVVKVPGEVQPIDLINDQMVLRARTELELGSRDRSLAEELVFHLQDAHTENNAARIGRCLGAL